MENLLGNPLYRTSFNSLSFFGFPLEFSLFTTLYNVSDEVYSNIVWRVGNCVPIDLYRSKSKQFFYN